MTETIICALITGFVSLSGSILAFITASKQMQKKTQENQQAQIDSLRTDLTKKLDDQKKELTDKLEAHRTEYLNGISDVHDSISDIKTEYVKSAALIEQKIDYLEKKQDKHNSIIERTFKLEQDSAVQAEQIKMILRGIANEA